MRVTTLLLILAASATAQSDPGKPVQQGLRGAVAAFAKVPEEDQAALLKASAALLSKHVTFRPDGTASSFCTFSGRRQVEWRRLAVSDITLQAINEADRLNGTTRRYLISLTSDAHRSWDPKTNAWGAWQPIGHVLFPSGLMFDWKNHRWTATQTDPLKHFIPGPGLSTATPKPATPSNALPPGMTRGK